MDQNEWYSTYSAALLELNPTKRRTLIREAENAILSGLQSLPEDPDSNREREIMADALSSLRALQRTAPHYL